jgi:hypothetical protein
MTELALTPPKLGFVISTRAALALGRGLLLSSRLADSKRRGLGSGLVALGALTTIPAVWMIARSRRK